jgi:hypothetical protein
MAGPQLSWDWPKWQGTRCGTCCATEEKRCRKPRGRKSGQQTFDRDDSDREKKSPRTAYLLPHSGSNLKTSGRLLRRPRLQLHHLGGVKHATYFTILLCFPHHKRVTIAIQQMGRQSGGVDLMKYTPDVAERARRARLAALVFFWFVDECLLDAQKEKLTRRRSHERQTMYARGKSKLRWRHRRRRPDRNF